MCSLHSSPLTHSWVHGRGFYMRRKLEPCVPYVHLSTLGAGAHPARSLRFFSRHFQHPSHLLKDTHQRLSPYPLQHDDQRRTPLRSHITSQYCHTHGEAAVLPENARSTDFWTLQALHQGFKHTLPDQRDRRVPPPSYTLVTGGYLLLRSYFSNSAFPQTPANHLAS